MAQKLAPAEKNSTDISAASATFCISDQCFIQISKNPQVLGNAERLTPNPLFLAFSDGILNLTILCTLAFSDGILFSFWHSHMESSSHVNRYLL